MDDLEIVQSEHASGYDHNKEEDGKNRRAVPPPLTPTSRRVGGGATGWSESRGFGFFLEPVIPEIQFRHDNFLLLL